MTEKIKKLVESTNYDDNRLALILIAEHYTLEGLKRILPNEGQTAMWGLCPDKYNPSGILIDDTCLFYTRDGCITWHTGVIVREDNNFIRWNLKEKED